MYVPSIPEANPFRFCSSLCSVTHAVSAFKQFGIKINIKHTV